jgi:hypothetical protein
MNNEKSTISLWEYAIIRAGLQAQKELRERNGLNSREIHANLTLLNLARETVTRLERRGYERPAADLSYPPATA